MNRWLLLAAGYDTRRMSDAQLIDAANRARRDGHHGCVALLMAVLRERAA